MKKKPIKEIIVNLEDMGLPDSIAEVDLFSPREQQHRIIQEVPKKPDLTVSEYEELCALLKKSFEELSRAKDKLSDLQKLFHVNKEGEDFDVSYKVVFGKEIPSEQDEHTMIIMDNFIATYSLDLSKITRDFKLILNATEAKLLRGAPSYCEVDLFDKEKEPVEC